MVNRRYLLLGSVATGALALGGCGVNPSQIDTVLATVIADARMIYAGLVGAMAMLPASVLGEPLRGLASSALDIVSSTVNALSQVSDSASAMPLVQKLETYVNSFVSVVAGIPFLPPPVSTALQAAAVLLPVLEAAVGLAITSVSNINMSPHQARAMLLQTAG